MDQERKKQLIKDYKRKLNIGAVYYIECRGNHRRILFSTIDIGSIKNRYAFSRSINGCPDPSFYGEWTKYGTESFSLVVLEELKMKEDQTAQDFADDIKMLLEMWREKPLDELKGVEA